MLAVDTNILVYAEGIGDRERVKRSERLLAATAGDGLIVAVQVVAELYRVLRIKARLPSDEVRTRIARYESIAVFAPTLPSTLADAVDLSARNGFQIFDAIILAASAEARGRLLVSEDMQDGFIWRGVTVVNPFAATPHPLLADAMGL